MLVTHLEAEPSISSGKELINMFVAREEETKKLKAFLSSPRQKTAIIYGRRRVGKTNLLRKVIEGRTDTVYYLCGQNSESLNTAGLAKVFNAVFSQPDYSYASFDQLLERIFEFAKTHSVVLILDEYPYLGAAKNGIEGIDSIIQRYIDLYRDEADFKLILCGSYVDTMKSLMDEENPLHGRFDLKMMVKPMNYFDISGFYPNFSDEDKIRMYSVFGGIPYYNSFIDDSLSVRENIIRLITDLNSVLESEISIDMNAEINKIPNAADVFSVLAAGTTSFSHIQSRSHIPSSPTLTRILTKLMDLQLVRKEAPINDPNNKKKTHYCLDDPLMMFYYKYVYPNRSAREIMDPEAFYNRFIDKAFETQFVPKAFEKVCREYLIRLNRKGLMDPPFFSIGRYYYDDPAQRKNGEFDNVCQDDFGYIFYESKFQNTKVSRQMIDAEEAQVTQTGLNCYKYGFFSRSGFACSPKENEVFFDLDLLYKD